MMGKQYLEVQLPLHFYGHLEGGDHQMPDPETFMQRQSKPSLEPRLKVYCSCAPLSLVLLGNIPHARGRGTPGMLQAHGRREAPLQEHASHVAGEREAGTPGWR